MEKPTVRRPLLGDDQQINACRAMAGVVCVGGARKLRRAQKVVEQRLSLVLCRLSQLLARSGIDQLFSMYVFMYILRVYG